MNPNQLAINRVYVREINQLASDDTLSLAAPPGNQIVVEWEAGAVVNAAAAAPVTFQIEIWDITTGAVAAPPLTLVPWNPVTLNGDSQNTAYEQTEPIPVATLAPHLGSMCEIHACLQVAPNIVSFAKSEPFYVFP